MLSQREVPACSRTAYTIARKTVLLLQDPCLTVLTVFCQVALERKGDERNEVRTYLLGRTAPFILCQRDDSICS